MFVVLLTYKKSLEEIETHLAEHRAFLDLGYSNNLFLLSGPMLPRTGGVIISQLKKRDELEHVLKQDPFFVHELADYQIVEFHATKNHPHFFPSDENGIIQSLL